MLLVALVLERDVAELADRRFTGRQQGELPLRRGEQCLRQHASLFRCAVHPDVDGVAVVRVARFGAVAPGAVGQRLVDGRLQVVVALRRDRDGDGPAVGRDRAVELRPAPAVVELEVGGTHVPARRDGLPPGASSAHEEVVIANTLGGRRGNHCNRGRRDRLLRRQGTGGEEKREEGETRFHAGSLSGVAT